MFSKQYMKFGSTALMLLAALAAGGCGTTTVYRATPEDTRDLSPAQARKLLIKEAQTVRNCDDPRTVSVTYEKIEVTCGKKGYGIFGDFWRPFRAFRFADNPALVATLGGAYPRYSGDASCINASGGFEDCMFFWTGTSSHSSARDFVRAWYVLARAGVVDPAQEAAFESVVQGYRNASVKPQLPEEAVKYKVQAELAVQQKRFDDAIDLYEQALGIAPWWPAGHYNRGLILGELQDYKEGIRALQKYLKLEPDASNARAVQLKIYQWESLVPRAAK
ncbi:MAG TPA: tetratricopeptide repeat protein [Acidiferrobacterales bacterium]|jgi:tetratricopeptide (TPR) repeat protein